MAVDGRDDIGGLDIDAAIVEHLRTDDWQRLMEPSTVEERRAQRQLWDDVRIAKERLSRSQAADFVVPLLDTEAHLTRDELERIARPVLDQTVRVTKGLLNWADLPEGRLAGVFLVGGASRIPLVATLLHRELGEAPVVIEQPELVVAEGSILAGAALLATGPAAPGPTAELRLVSTGRAESATVRVAVKPAMPAPAPHLPGTTGLQPAVDPWPDAGHGDWAPDPHATVATTPPPFTRSPADEPSGPALSRGTSPRGAASVAPPFERPRSAPPAAVVPPRTDTVPKPPARGAPRPPVPTVRRPRRRGRFLRSVQVLLSMLVMVLVPLVALLVAYGYGNGDSLDVDAANLIDDIRELLGI
jgi:hypothetical protein